MPYCLVIFPKIDTSAIEAFRKKHDPYCELIYAHVTVVFPTPTSVGRQALIDHIDFVLKSEVAFPIRLKGFHKAWDHWLFLTLKEGNDVVKRLHKRLYSGILAQYLRDDIPFVPHIGLGLFAKGEYDVRDPQAIGLDEKAYARALQEAEELNLDYLTVVDALHLVELDEAFTKIFWSKEFPLAQTR